MHSSENISEISAAIVKSQAAFTGVSKDATNPFFNSKYADINAVLDMAQPILSANGIAILQLPAPATNGVRIQTVLMHESGEWISDDGLDIVAPKQDPQGYGQAMTYGRRYSAISVLGLRTEDDDAQEVTRGMSKIEMAKAKAAERKES